MPGTVKRLVRDHSDFSSRASLLNETPVEDRAVKFRIAAVIGEIPTNF
jgi:hypothetical protein